MLIGKSYRLALVIVIATLLLGALGVSALRARRGGPALTSTDEILRAYGKADLGPELPGPGEGASSTDGFFCNKCTYHHGNHWGIAPAFNLRREAGDIRGLCPSCLTDSGWSPGG